MGPFKFGGTTFNFSTDSAQICLQILPEYCIVTKVWGPLPRANASCYKQMGKVGQILYTLNKIEYRSHF